MRSVPHSTLAIVDLSFTVRGAESLLDAAQACDNRLWLFWRLFAVELLPIIVGLQRAVDLGPVNVVQQVLDAIVGAVDQKLKVFNAGRVRRVDKFVVEPVVLRVPGQRLRIAEKQQIGGPAGVTFVF